MSVTTVDIQADRIRYMETRIERLCSDAARSDLSAREHLKRAETAEARVAHLEAERDIARQNHADACRLARERLDRIHDLETEMDRFRRRAISSRTV